MNLQGLGYPALRPVRERLVWALVELAADVPRSLKALGLSPRGEFEVERNAGLRDAPTLPALRRYTGVLFDALDVGSMRPAEFRRAGARLAVCSALFGLVRGHDRIPAYRLSAGSTLPGEPSIGSLWRTVLPSVLSTVDSMVVDLRSGPYASLGVARGAITVAVVSAGPSGTRVAPSHHNKSYKGRLARALALRPRAPRSVTDLLETAEAAGLRVEQTARRSLALIVDARHEPAPGARST
ncbi:MAG: YaaA family protein [Sciscionella sp.]